MALMKSMMLFVMSMAVVPSVEAVEVSPSNRAPVIAAGLWEVSAINQSIALQVSPEDVKPFFLASAGVLWSAAKRRCLMSVGVQAIKWFAVSSAATLRALWR